MAGSAQEWSSELGVQRQEVKRPRAQGQVILYQEEKVPPSFDSVAPSFLRPCLKQGLLAPEAS